MAIIPSQTVFYEYVKINKTKTSPNRLIQLPKLTKIIKLPRPNVKLNLLVLAGAWLTGKASMYAGEAHRGWESLGHGNSDPAQVLWLGRDVGARLGSGDVEACLEALQGFPQGSAESQEGVESTRTVCSRCPSRSSEPAENRARDSSVAGLIEASFGFNWEGVDSGGKARVEEGEVGRNRAMVAAINLGQNRAGGSVRGGWRGRERRGERMQRGRGWDGEEAMRESCSCCYGSNCRRGRSGEAMNSERKKENERTRENK